MRDENVVFSNKKEQFCSKFNAETWKTPYSLKDLSKTESIKVTFENVAWKKFGEKFETLIFLKTTSFVKVMLTINWDNV